MFLDYYETISNNAGVVRSHMLFNISDEEWDEVVKVHLYGHFYCTRAACRWFRQQRSGRIVNTSSGAGLGVPGGIHYSAAKEGIVGLTRSVAIEMARYNVTCNAIRPLAFTRATQSVQPKPGDREETVEHKGAFFRQMAGIEESSPEDIAPLVAYLVSDEAASISGRTFLVLRGQVSLYSEPDLMKTVHKDGSWTVDELAAILPATLAAGLTSSAPPQQAGQSGF